MVEVVSSQVVLSGTLYSTVPPLPPLKSREAWWRSSPTTGPRWPRHVQAGTHTGKHLPSLPPSTCPPLLPAPCPPMTPCPRPVYSLPSWWGAPRRVESTNSEVSTVIVTVTVAVIRLSWLPVSAPIEKSLDASFYLAMPQKGNFVRFFKQMYIKCEVQKKKKMWSLVLPLHKERFVFPYKCACNIMNYTRLNIWSIGQTLKNIQTGLCNI